MSCSRAFSVSGGLRIRGATWIYRGCATDVRDFPCSTKLLPLPFLDLMLAVGVGWGEMGELNSLVGDTCV